VRGEGRMAPAVDGRIAERPLAQKEVNTQLMTHSDKLSFIISRAVAASLQLPAVANTMAARNILPHFLTVGQPKCNSLSLSLGKKQSNTSPSIHLVMKDPTLLILKPRNIVKLQQSPKCDVATFKVTYSLNFLSISALCSLEN
jgi:hypothetical protein